MYAKSKLCKMLIIEENRVEFDVEFGYLYFPIHRFLITGRTKVRVESISKIKEIVQLGDYREKKLNKSKHSIRNLYDNMG